MVSRYGDCDAPREAVTLCPLALLKATALPAECVRLVYLLDKFRIVCTVSMTPLD